MKTATIQLTLSAQQNIDQSKGAIFFCGKPVFVPAKPGKPARIDLPAILSDAPGEPCGCILLPAKDGNVPGFGGIAGVVTIKGVKTYVILECLGGGTM